MNSLHDSARLITAGVVIWCRRHVFGIAISYKNCSIKLSFSGFVVVAEMERAMHGWVGCLARYS